MKDNAWFVGFAPRAAPEIVVVALFEHGEHGQFAGAHRARRDEGLFRQEDTAGRAAAAASGRRRRRLPLVPDPRPPAPVPSPAPGPRTNMSRHLSLRDIDWTLLMIVLLICGVGVLQIYSATCDTGFHSAWWKQILYVLGGLVLMWMAWRWITTPCCTMCP